MANHKWRFFRAGGVEQVALRGWADLSHLAELDPKLWVALSMPTRGVEIDARTLEHIDSDHDGRVRIPEVLAAVRFVEDTLADPEAVMRGGDGVALAEVKDERVAAAAKRVLAALGRGAETTITLADIAAHAAIVAKLELNGDGVLPPDSAGDGATKQVILDIIDSVGGVNDTGGATGVDQAHVDRFFTEAQALSEWHAKGETGPFGDRTPEALAAVQAVRGKVDDYFTRCRLAAFDARAAAALSTPEPELAALAGKELSPSSAEVAKLPLARVEAGRPLPLQDGINPAWRAAIATLATAALAPLGRRGGQLTEADWAEVQGKLSSYEAWAVAKPATIVEKLGLERLRAVLGGPARTTIAGLIAKDTAQGALNAEVALVERLLLYKRDLREILENFVNFSRFYARKGAAFQAGMLYLDARSCSLCVEVTDAAKHGLLATMASTFLAYCDLTRPDGARKTIVAAFTGGDDDNLFVGRNGVFVDRKGRDWDATITKIIANPISVREAFWAPYKKFFRFLEEQIAKRAAAAAADSTAALAKAATDAASVGGAAAKPLEVKKVDVGTVAAIGVAVGGIGAMVVGLLTAFFGLGIWMPIGVLGLILLISGPSMALAYLKLRHRNLGPLLDASGWAVNGRARINVPFGGALTEVATLPKGSERSLQDPYAEKRPPLRLYLALAVVLALAVAWYLGRLDGVLPRAARSTTVLGR
jgi:hypothetical protein